MSAADPEVVVIYVTAPDATVAGLIARAVVEAREAACANILPGALSVFRWEGAVETAAECVLVIKTVAGRTEDVIRRVRALHPYDIPAIVAWPVTAGHPAFLDWVRAECGAG